MNNTRKAIEIQAFNEAIEGAAHDYCCEHGIPNKQLGFALGIDRSNACRLMNPAYPVSLKLSDIYLLMMCGETFHLAIEILNTALVTYNEHPLNKYNDHEFAIVEKPKATMALNGSVEDEKLELVERLGVFLHDAHEAPTAGMIERLDKNFGEMIAAIERARKELRGMKRRKV